MILFTKINRNHRNRRAIKTEHVPHNFSNILILLKRTTQEILLHKATDNHSCTKQSTQSRTSCTFCKQVQPTGENIMLREAKLDLELFKENFETRSCSSTTQSCRNGHWDKWNWHDSTQDTGCTLSTVQREYWEALKAGFVCCDWLRGGHYFSVSKASRKGTGQCKRGTKNNKGISVSPCKSPIQALIQYVLRIWQTADSCRSCGRWDLKQSGVVQHSHTVSRQKTRLSSFLQDF